MKSFVKGILFGVGVGLLTAPMRGTELRGLLRDRFMELRGRLPEKEQLSQYKQQVSERVGQTAGNLQGYAQQAASTVKSSASNMASMAQNAASTAKQTGQDYIEKAKQTVKRS